MSRRASRAQRGAVAIGSYLLCAVPNPASHSGLTIMCYSSDTTVREHSTPAFTRTRNIAAE
jgi:hypothetical protein